MVVTMVAVVSYREPCVECLFQGLLGCVLGEEGPCDQRDLCWWSVEWWLL